MKVQLRLFRCKDDTVAQGLGANCMSLVNDPFITSFHTSHVKHQPGFPDYTGTPGQHVQDK